MNKKDDTGAFLIFAGIAAVLFAIAYFCDIDKLSKSFDKFCTSDDPANFVILVIIGIAIGGLLMAIESRPKK